MSSVEERWQERLTESRAKMSSAIKPGVLAERYDAETEAEIREPTNQAVKEMIRADGGMVTLDDLDKAEEKLDEAGDFELATDGGQVETDHEIRCYHCERVVARRSVSMIETAIDHNEGLGYEMVPVPCCRACQLEQFGHSCDRCGRRHLDLEDAIRCCDHELGPVPGGESQ